MSLIKPPVVRAQMLIRKPAKEVFEALIDPDITTKFWFTKSNGIVEEGKTLRWDWEMYGVHAIVNVKKVEQNKRIVIEWDDPPTTVEWQFIPHSDKSTLVIVTNSGFKGSDNEMVEKALDSMGGFTSLLADLKAYLEHSIQLNLVADHHPQ